DILVLAQRGLVVDSVAPSKLLSYMASAKPVVAAVNQFSEAARVVREAGCGVVVPPEDAPALADAVRRLRSRPEWGASLGAAGRSYVAAHFSRTAVITRWLDLLEESPSGRC